MEGNWDTRYSSLRRARVLGHRYAVGTLVLAGVLFGAVTSWRFAASDSLLEGIDFLYAVPIALVAARFRTVGGAAAAALGVGLVTVWAETAAVTLSPEGYLIRAVTFVAVAFVVGVQGERRQQGESEAARWFSISTEMLCIADTNGRLMRVNDAWMECLGYTADELLGRPFTELVHPEDLMRTRASLDAAVDDLRVSADFDNRCRAKDGRWHWLSWTLRVDGDCIYAAGRDITDRKRLERELEALAHEDTLTGLPNRRAWEARLSEELPRAARSREPVCVAILDLDGLKAVNDGSGHAAGDELLRESALRWRVALREVDLIARLGGDEFGVLLPSCDETAARDVVRRLCERVPAGHSVSAGVAAWDRSESKERLVRRADESLYAAKAARSRPSSVEGDLPVG